MICVEQFQIRKKWKSTIGQILNALPTFCSGHLVEVGRYSEYALRVQAVQT